MTRMLVVSMMAFAVGCGPGSGDEAAELRNELAGFYSTRVEGGEVLASSTWISIYEFRSDGTGSYHRLSCLKEISEEVEFEWSVERGGMHAAIEFEGEYSAMSGQWTVPGQDCSADSTSIFDFEPGVGVALLPGRRCNPQLGVENVDGVQTCEFEVCGGESIRCGGADVEGGPR